jgi:glycosyltransferase involved in cell wall biosynthesis
MSDDPERVGADGPLLSVVVPAFDEEDAIVGVLQRLTAELSGLGCAAEIIVVDDGSRDRTGERASGVPGIRLVRNPVNLGYGHSLMRGIAAARGRLIAISDADGSYPPTGLRDLLALVHSGADHVIGLRTGPHVKRPWLTRSIYRQLCGYVVGCRVPDANSGFRVFRREVAESLREDLCLGFSFTTSLTLASIMTGYVVTYSAIPYERRAGRSHVRYRDVLRTAQYLFQLVAVYNPLKLFLPLVVISGLLACAALLLAATGRATPANLLVVAIVEAPIVMVGLAALAYIASRARTPVQGHGMLPRAQGRPPAT